MGMIVIKPVYFMRGHHYLIYTLNKGRVKALCRSLFHAVVEKNDRYQTDISIDVI